MNDVDQNIGRLITKWRKAAGLSQAALAEALGTQQGTVSKLEAGLYRLTVAQLVAVLDACGIKLTAVACDIEHAADNDYRPLWERIDE